MTTTTTTAPPPFRNPAPPGHRWFDAFPPDDAVPAPVARLVAEYRKLDAKRTAAATALAELDDPDRLAAAQALDVAAGAAAIRAGRPVKSSAVAELAEARDAAEEHLAMTDAAVASVAVELVDAFRDLDAAGYGRDRLEDALAAYAEAVATVVTAREACRHAAALPAFLRVAHGASASTRGYRVGTGPALVLPVPDGSGANPGHLRTTAAAVGAWLTADATDAEAWIAGEGRRR